MTMYRGPHVTQAGTDANPAITINIVSRSQLLRSGLAETLASLPNLRVHRVVGSFAELSIGDATSAIAILDVYPIRGLGGQNTAWTFLPSGVRAIALCRPEDPPDLATAVRSGVVGLLTRDADTADLSLAINAARRGGLHICAEILDRLVDRATFLGSGKPTRLADREIETLRWVAEGLTQGQISNRMGLSEATVSTYLKRIRAKLQASNKADLTRRAIELGYVNPRQPHAGVHK